MAGNKKARKQQTHISFSPLPSTSPAAKDYHEQIKKRAAAVRYEAYGSSPLKRKFADFSSPNRDAEASLPTPDTPDDGLAKASFSKHKLKRVRQQQLDLSAFTIPAHLMSSPAIATPRAEMQDQSSDSDNAPRRSGKKRRVQGGFMSSGRARRSDRRIDVEPITSSLPPVSSPLNTLQGVESDDDDDDMPTTAGTRKRGRVVRQPSPSPSIEAPSESDDDVEIVEPPETDNVNHDDEDSDLPATTPKRRLLKRRRKKEMADPDMTQQEREDLDEDLDFLRPSDDDTPTLSNNTQSARKNARLTALDALKRKRTGATQVIEEEEEEESAVEAEEDEEDELAYNNDPASSRTMFQADDADEDFLDDEDGELGAPEDIPIEFSKYASMKPKELFQYAIEWMVQKKINPAFEITNTLYDLTFRKLNDEVAGLVSSKYSSSAWTADFTLALRARPNIAVDTIGGGIDGDLLPSHCDACNRSNHPATFLIQFHGKPYYSDTLDDVEAGDDSSDTDDDDDKASYDSHKKQIPPASRTYQVGRFCAANAETAHELAHWKWSLYAWVVKWIDEENFNTPAKIVERDSWSTKKRRKQASKIADRMHESGVTKRLWKEFTDIIARAREGKQGRY